MEIKEIPSNRALAKGSFINDVTHLGEKGLLLSETIYEGLSKIGQKGEGGLKLSNFLEVGPIGPIFTPAHVLIVHTKHTDPFSVKLSNRTSYLNVASWRHGPWTSVKRGV